MTVSGFLEYVWWSTVGRISETTMGQLGSTTLVLSTYPASRVLVALYHLLAWQMEFDNAQ